MQLKKGFVGNMVHWGSALLMDVMLVFLLVVSVSNMVATGSALGSGAPRPLILEEGVTSIFTPRKSARWKDVILLLLNVVCVPRMVRTERASLMAAPPTQGKGFNIASSTAVERRHRALWQAAPPPLNARVSAPNTAVVLLNAGSQAAPTQWSAGSRPAQHTVGRVTVPSQNAGRLQSGKMATARSIPRSRKPVV